MPGPPVPSVFLYAIEEDEQARPEVRAPKAAARLGSPRSSGAVCADVGAALVQAQLWQLC